MADELEALERAVGALLAASEVELVDLEMRASTLTVTVTRAAGLDLEALAEAARAVSAFLDEHDDLTPTDPYELEVTTPGLERRLRKSAHFAQVVGQSIALRTTGSTPGNRRIEGLLVAADEKSVTIQVAGAPEARVIDYRSIDRAHTIFDWKAALASEKRLRRDEQSNSTGGAGGSHAAPVARGARPQHHEVAMKRERETQS